MSGSVHFCTWMSLISVVSALRIRYKNPYKSLYISYYLPDVHTAGSTGHQWSVAEVGGLVGAAHAPGWVAVVGDEGRLAGLGAGYVAGAGQVVSG